jgi:polyisoprenoid-binding protein YceI
VQCKIATREGNLTVKAFAAGMLSSLAHSPTFVIRSFEGEVELENKGTFRGALKLRMIADSIQLVDEFSPRERWDIMQVMQDEILEVGKFPEMVYDGPSSRTTVKSAGGPNYEVNWKGELRLHGVTKSQPVDARGCCTATGSEPQASCPSGNPTFSSNRSPWPAAS